MVHLIALEPESRWLGYMWEPGAGGLLCASFPHLGQLLTALLSVSSASGFSVVPGADPGITEEYLLHFLCLFIRLPCDERETVRVHHQVN